MNWQLDNSHSAVEFSVRHMMISKVRGHFESFSGEFQIDEQNPGNSTVEVWIDAASINTREEARDTHLKSADFLDAEQHPKLHFKSTRVEPTGRATAKLHGELTIRGVSRPVVIDVEHIGTSQSPWGQTAYGFEGRTKINRKEWGLVWNVALETGGVLVSDEISIDIALELIKVTEPQAEAVA